VAPTFPKFSGCPTILSRTLESGLNVSPSGKKLYPREYLRGASVTGRLGDIQVNEDGSKPRNDKNQKIIHRWDYGRNRSTWTTQSSANISKVLDHLKLGLGEKTASNIPDSLFLNVQQC
jgi:hypothetical protein